MEALVLATQGARASAFMALQCWTELIRSLYVKDKGDILKYITVVLSYSKLLGR